MCIRDSFRRTHTAKMLLLHSILYRLSYSKDSNILHCSRGMKSSRTRNYFKFRRKIMSMFTCVGSSFDTVSLLTRQDLNTSKLVFFCSVFSLSSNHYFSVLIFEVRKERSFRSNSGKDVLCQNLCLDY